MPLPISLAHKLAQRLAEVRKDGTLDYLRPDGKTQVSVRYRDGRPVAIEKLLISTQHREGAESLIPDDLWEHVVEPVIPAELYDAKKLRRDFLVNPTGRFVIGGPVGDAGLTGRKIIVDTYGGMARHGGGAFSGKDPSKVDRSAAYAARYVAKNVVAAGLAERCEVQVAYAIGVAHPVSLMVETFGTEKIARSQIAELVDEHFDLRPGAFREYLNLHRPIFQKTAAYGHFGREDDDFTWEKTDKAEALRAAAGLGRGCRRRLTRTSRRGSSSGRPRRPTRSRAATPTTTGGPGSTRPARRPRSPPVTRSTSTTATRRTSRCSRARSERAPDVARVVADRARARRVQPRGARALPARPRDARRPGSRGLRHPAPLHQPALVRATAAAGRRATRSSASSATASAWGRRSAARCRGRARSTSRRSSRAWATSRAGSRPASAIRASGSRSPARSSPPTPPPCARSAPARATRKAGICLQLPDFEPARPGDPDCEAFTAERSGARWPTSTSRTCPARSSASSTTPGSASTPRSPATTRAPPEGAPVTQMGWELNPDGLGRAIRLAAGSGLPVVITENGIATADDRERVAYMRAHLAQVAEALRDGIDVRGFMYWSAFDNFEWNEGYRPRFGMVAVDREDDLRRVVLPSARAYGELARTVRSRVRGGRERVRAERFVGELRNRRDPARHEPR